MVGVVHDGTARTNVYLVDASGSGSRATVELLDLEGNVLAAKQYTLAGWQPVLESLDRLGGAAVSAGTLRVQVTEGAVIAGASRGQRSFRRSDHPDRLGAGVDARRLGAR